ncbi:MAG: PAC2 family protein [Dehalococcoidia bacterium]|nr:PAC2 family protein [Dehalococcoidia bacterium]
MPHLLMKSRPELRAPLLVTAFAGWNDAGEAATSAVRFVRRRWRTEPFAELDPEEFYDFTQSRPRVRLDRSGQRLVEWPRNIFSAQRIEGAEHDVILLEGIEPHLSWRTYVDTITEVCKDLNVAGVITLGALLAEVAHTRPVRVTGSSPDASMQTLLRLEPAVSRYEGPTGIVGILNQAVRAAGIPTASMWANIPYYLNASPNPKGSLAILERVNPMLKLGLGLHDLEVFAARFDAQVASEIAKDPETLALSRQIESRQDAAGSEGDVAVPQEPAESELPDGASMVEDLERYLREQREGGSN